MKSQTTNSRHGLLSGGNWIVDQVKLIDVYPQPEQLGNIRAQSQGTGGAPYNVLIDLAKSGAPFPLFGAGLVRRPDRPIKVLGMGDVGRKFTIKGVAVSASARTKIEQAGGTIGS